MSNYTGECTFCMFPSFFLFCICNIKLTGGQLVLVILYKKEDDNDVIDNIVKLLANEKPISNNYQGGTHYESRL